MYLFSRVATANPNRFPESIEWAVKIAKRVESTSGASIRVYTSVFGDSMNTLSWGTTYTSLGEMQAVKDKLLADSGYQAEIKDAEGLFVGAPQDLLLRIVAASFDAHPKRYYHNVSFEAAPGKAAEALAIGVKLQAHITSALGCQSLFGTSPYGPNGSAALIIGVDSLDELDTYFAKRSKDAAMGSLMTEASLLVRPGSGHSRLIERIA